MNKSLSKKWGGGRPPRAMIDSCEEFRCQMNQAIDRREDPGSVREIRRHVRQCESCACELNAWVQIQSLYAPVVPPVGRKSDGISIPWGILVLTAAAIVFGALGTYFTFQDRPENLVSIQSPATSPSPSKSDQRMTLGGSSVESWFTHVDTERWIDETMPAVRNVGEGVAPLGRSIRQAVSILAPKSSSSVDNQQNAPSVQSTTGSTL